jgi:hypothetical protein
MLVAVGVADGTARTAIKACQRLDAAWASRPPTLRTPTSSTQATLAQTSQASARRGSADQTLLNCSCMVCSPELALTIA